MREIVTCAVCFFSALIYLQLYICVGFRLLLGNFEKTGLQQPPIHAGLTQSPMHSLMLKEAV